MADLNDSWTLPSITPVAAAALADALKARDQWRDAFYAERKRHDDTREHLEDERKHHDAERARLISDADAYRAALLEITARASGMAKTIARGETPGSALARLAAIAERALNRT